MVANQERTSFGASARPYAGHLSWVLHEDRQKASPNEIIVVQRRAFFWKMFCEDDFSVPKALKFIMWDKSI